ncbi:MAG: hypothetical protein WDZ69_01265 [Candidatus Pacearchaeota archaeon]
MDGCYVDKIGEALVFYDGRRDLYDISINPRDNGISRDRTSFQFKKEELESISKDPNKLIRHIQSKKDFGRGLSDIDLKSIQYAIQVASEEHYRNFSQ